MFNAILNGKTDLTDAENAAWERNSIAVLSSPNTSTARKVATLAAVQRVAKARQGIPHDQMDMLDVEEFLDRVNPDWTVSPSDVDWTADPFDHSFDEDPDGP